MTISHGHTRGRAYSPEYKSWSGMVQRATNPSNPQWKDYGGRGVTLCDSWRKSFESFLTDMGPRPSRQHSIDRIDNDKGYEPGNCRWATRTEQNRNKRSSRMLTVEGVTKCLSEWCEERNLPLSTVKLRLKRGWSPDKALSEPVIIGEGEANAMHKLTAADVVEIRRLYASGGYSQAALGRRFGISQTVVGQIVRRVRWQHVE